MINNTTGAATVRALFDNKSGMLRSGSTGQVLIPNNFKDVIIIPQGATSELQNIRFAYVVNDSNKIVATPIEVSNISEDVYKRQMEKRVECDVWYIEHWNFFLDLKIIVLTVINAIRGEENAF